MEHAVEDESLHLQYGQRQIRLLRLEEHYQKVQAPFWTNPNILMLTDAREEGLQALREQLVTMLHPSAHHFDAVFVFTDTDLELAMKQWRSLGPHARLISGFTSENADLLTHAQHNRRVHNLRGNILVVLDCDISGRSGRCIEKLARIGRHTDITLAVLGCLPRNGILVRRRVPSTIRVNCDVLVTYVRHNTDVCSHSLYGEFFGALETRAEMDALLAQAKAKRLCLTWRNAGALDAVQDTIFCLPHQEQPAEPFPCVEQARDTIEHGILGLTFESQRRNPLFWTRASVSHAFDRSVEGFEALDAQAREWVLHSAQYRAWIQTTVQDLCSVSLLPNELINLVVHYVLPGSSRVQPPDR